MPSIRSRLFGEGVTDTVVPGQTRTSPPPDKRKIVVSDPAVMVEPEPMRLPAITVAPEPLVTGTTAGVAPKDNAGDVGGWFGDGLPAFTSSGGLSRTISRFPAPSQV